MLNADVEANWPALPLDGWSDTYATVHRWVQIVGKVRLTQSPWVNHSWHVTLYVSSRGLTTGSIPYDERSFQIDFDFIQHRLQIHSTEGKRGGFDLVPESVAAFYGKLMREMERLGLPVTIYGKPCELEDALPFADDTAHCAYDRDAVHRFWRILVQADRVLKIFRARFLGKASPVHLFWGALDLAVTRFSGRPA